jgi:hypothetical protein
MAVTKMQALGKWWLVGFGLHVVQAARTWEPVLLLSEDYPS